MTQKKIIILINTITPYQLDFFESLKKKINLKIIFYSKNYINYNFKFKKKKYHVLLNEKKDPLKTIFREINQFNPDLIIFGGYRLKFSSKIITVLKDRKIPFLYWLENLDQNKYLKYKLVNHLISKKIKKSNGVLAVGKSAQNLYSKNCDNVINLPYSIKIDKAKKKFSYKNNKINFLFVGQLIKRKGLHIILNAFDNLNEEERKKVSLSIVGEGDLKNYLRKFMIKKSFIKYHGFVFGNKLSAIYENSDILIFPSIFDGWGVVPMEAMSKSLSLIISEKAGVSEILKNNKNGFIIPPNTKELLKIVKRCIKNRKIIASQGLRNRKLILNSNCNSKNASTYLIKNISKII